MKLQPENVEDIYALTSLQEGILFYYLKNEDCEYNEQIVLRIEEEMDFNIFVKTWEKIVQNHSVLRTVFRWEEAKQHLQIVLKQKEPEIKFCDLSLQNEKEAVLNEQCKMDLETRFNLKNNAIRITLYKMETEKFAVVITNHHIIYDGWSNGILIKEFLTAYKSIAKEEPAILSLGMPYKNYIMWLQENQNSGRKYWSEYLKDFHGYAGTVEAKHEGTDDYYFQLDEVRIHSFLKENKLTLAMLLYAAWGMTLSKLDRCEDVILGTTVSGRNVKLPKVEQTVGLFINTIPLRLKINKNMQADEVLKQVCSSLLEREDYEHTPLTEIKKVSEIGSDSELFNTIMVIENYPLDRVQEEDMLKVSKYEANELNNYDLTIGVETGSKIRVDFSYQKVLYSREKIISMAKSFENIVNQIMDNGEQKVNEISLLTVKEEMELAKKLTNKTDKFQLENNNVIEAFEKMAEKYPEHIAVSYEEKELTYIELEKKSNQLARVLQKKGLEREKIAAIRMENSLGLIIAMMAVVKAGGAFTMISMDMPAERMNSIIENCKASILITNEEYESDLTEVLYYDSHCEIKESTGKLSLAVEPNQLLYVIQTSGTTGIPQGVMIEHRNLLTYMESVSKYLNITDKDSTIQLCAVTFDTFIDEVFLALLNGGTFVMPRTEELRNINRIHEIILKKQVTVLSCVPMLLNLFNQMKTMQSVRIIISGGDVLKYENISNLILHADVYNSYGPSEATIAPVYYKVKENTDKVIPIGTPLEGASAYILDPDCKLCPKQIIGELYLGGTSVSRGYLMNDKLTRERFLKLQIGGKTESVYKTGDLCYWDNEGQLMFIGRDDGQVKFHGVRIELRDIEIQIRSFQSVSDVVVSVEKDSYGRTHLCAFVVAEGEKDVKKLKLYVKKKLPENMFPSYWILLPKIPSTRHGKIDYNALRSVLNETIENKKKNQLKPENEIEEKLCKIWCDVLQTEDIGVEDDFFEIGGDSIKLITIYTQIGQQFEQKVSVQNLFDYRSIRELAEYMLSLEQEEEETNLIDF